MEISGAPGFGAVKASWRTLASKVVVVAEMCVSELGSLTVTGPAGVVVGAKGKLGAVSIEAGPPELGAGVGPPVKLDARTCYPEGEVGTSEQTSSW